MSTQTYQSESGVPDLGLASLSEAAVTGVPRVSADDLVDGPWLDTMLASVDKSGLRLTGEGGFLPALIRAVLERGLQAELADHLGYEKGDPAGRGAPNSRNGATPKTLATEIGDVELDTPRDRNSSFEPRLVPKGARRLGGGLDEQIVSLYAGGMTVRDIGHHLERTLGVELSHETISKITEAVAEEVKAWQTRPLDEVYPILYIDALVVKSATPATSPTRPPRSWSGSTPTGSSTCSGSGCSPPRAPSSGCRCSPSYATGASRTC